MAIKNTTVSRSNPYFSSLVYPTITPVTGQLTSAAERTLTAAELLGGLVTVDTDDAQNCNLPSAAAINAALAGPAVGSAFEVTVINYGDSNLTLVVGAGITNVAISGVDAIMVIAANTAGTFLLRCTQIAQPNVVGSVDAYDLYRVGAGTVLS